MKVTDIKTFAVDCFRTNWVFVKVYTDEGISGTNTKRREGFNEMVADALAGKIEIKTAELIQFDFPLPQSFEG